MKCGLSVLRLADTPLAVDMKATKSGTIVAIRTKLFKTFPVKLISVDRDVMSPLQYGTASSLTLAKMRALRQVLDPDIRR